MPIEPVSTTRPPGGADRPLNGVLARERTDSLGLTPLRHWREGLAEYMRAARASLRPPSAPAAWRTSRCATRLRPGVAVVTLVALACARGRLRRAGGRHAARAEDAAGHGDDSSTSTARARPARAFLEWFQALQLGQPRELARYYVPSLGLTPDDARARSAEPASYAIDPLAPPIIKSVTTNGPEARVTCAFRTGRIWPNGRVDYTTSP